ncbi:hypothetical protein FS842_003940 [Serendipita sp. 407]|nr:hypothetical protein FS842_003940 [Serendipita sp. 407]
MNLGARALQAQSHMKDGVLHFCHTSCLLFDGGSVLSYLQKVKGFMDSHPFEVFTFVFTNPERVSPKAVWSPLFEQSGLASMAYVPPHLPMKATEWPTLGEMIQTGKRLVVFMDYGSNPAEVSYILPQFDHIWEPPFSSTDPNFPCRVDRISGPLSSQDHMFMINHNLNVKVFPWVQRRSPSADPGFFDTIAGAINNGINAVKDTVNNGVSTVVGAVNNGIDQINNGIGQINNGVDQGKDTLASVLVPDFLNAAKTNSMSSIVKDSEGCAPFSGGKRTNFVMLDFIDLGDGRQAVENLNGFF